MAEPGSTRWESVGGLWTRVRSRMPGRGPRWVTPPPPGLVPEMDRSEEWLLRRIDELVARKALDEGHGDAFDAVIQSLVDVWRQGDMAHDHHYLARRERLGRMLIDLEVRQARLQELADATDAGIRAVDGEIRQVLDEIGGVRGNGTAPRSRAGPPGDPVPPPHPDEPTEADNVDR